MAQANALPKIALVAPVAYYREQHKINGKDEDIPEPQPRAGTAPRDHYPGHLGGDKINRDFNAVSDTKT